MDKFRWWPAAKQALYVALLVVISGPSPVDASNRTCDTKLVSETISPDRRFIASVREFVCEESFFVTVVGASVNVAPVDVGYSEASDVLVVDTGGHRENIPRTIWHSATELWIALPNLSLIGLHRARIGVIGVTLRFEPDDPVARARFLEMLKRL